MDMVIGFSPEHAPASDNSDMTTVFPVWRPPPNFCFRYKNVNLAFQLLHLCVAHARKCGKAR